MCLVELISKTDEASVEELEMLMSKMYARLYEHRFNCDKTRLLEQLGDLCR